MTAADAWQDISTAPRDRTRILVWDEEDREAVIALFDPVAGCLIHSPGAWPVQATHWQPLPAPPSDADG